MTPHASPAASKAGHAVIRAGQADLDILSQIIAGAFVDLAVSQWLITDVGARREIFPGYFRLSVEHAMASGFVYTTPGRTAVALWVPIGEDGPRPPGGYGARLAAATGPWISRFEVFDAALDRHHPAGVPHHHLALLAVRPDSQRQGIGTRLLHAHHTVLDRDGMPGYLEASGLDTRRIYLRYGYADYGNVIQFPDGGPRMYPMMRQPDERHRAG